MCIDIQFIPHHLLKRWPFPHWILFALLLNISCLNVWVSFWSLYSVRWHTYLSLCQCRIALITLSLQDQKTSSTFPQIVFFLLRVVLAIISSLNFYIILGSAWQILQDKQISKNTNNIAEFLIGIILHWIYKSIFRIWYLNNIEYSYPETWCISAFICL